MAQAMATVLRRKVESPLTVDHLANEHPYWGLQPWSGRTFYKLTCVQVRADEGIHNRGRHHIYGNPRVASENLMQEVISRHNARRCGCFDYAQVIAVNLLSIAGQGGTDLGIPCQLVWADSFVVKEFVETCYGEPKPLDEASRRYLQQRHDSHQCACQVPWSAGVVEMGKAPDPRLEPLAA